MNPAPKRLFVAIQPTAPVRAALTSLIGDMGGARWTPPVNFHLTLSFIGDVSSDLIRAIEAALERVQVGSFFLALEGVGRFPARGRPAVVWAGVSGHPHLLQLRQRVDDGLLAAGVSLELRSFVPHFTLARTGNSTAGAVEQWLKHHREFTGPAWRVDAFHLMESDLHADGAEHRVLRTFSLLL